MTSEVEERPRLVTAGTGVNGLKQLYYKENLKQDFNLFDIILAGKSSTGTLYSFFNSYNGQILSNEENIECIPNCPKAPQISFDKSSFTEDRMSPENCDVCDCVSFFEWLGCIACGVDW